MSLIGCQQLFKHQSDAIKFVLGRNGSGAIFHEIGLGKTRTAIEIYDVLRINHTGLRLMVFAPLSLLEAAWRADVRKFSGFSFRNLHDEGIPDKSNPAW